MKKVLIVEDDQIVANVYRNKFAVEGFQVELAMTGEAGLDLVKSFQPDAVLIDLVLPKMSGVELMRRIRQMPDLSTLPLIVFSNTYLTNMVQDAWKAGATKCLSKSNCSPKQVIEALRSSLGINTEAPAKQLVAEPRSKLSAPSPVAPAKPKPSASDSLRQNLPSIISSIRATISALTKATTPESRTPHTHELYRHVHGLTGAASVAGFNSLTQMCEALEALTVELHEKPASINQSTLRTIASALDSIPSLLDRKPTFGDEQQQSSNILVVDDESISRRAVTQALDRAKLKSVGVDDPKAALQLLTDNPYDLVFLDVEMPGMTGHELCAKLRAMPLHKHTPVVFVTSHSDFQNRANSMMSGGNDFIAKPFPFLELAVKSLVYVLRGKQPTVRLS